MNNYNKYLKYKNKYLQLKNKLKQTGGNINGTISIQKENIEGIISIQNEDDENYYVGHGIEDDMTNAKPTIYLFKASWCGHCKNFRSVWNSIAKNFSENVNFITYDSDINKQSIKEWKITGFPTIITRTNTSAQEYTGDRDLNSLINHIKSFIN
jgi:thiol-disulfide isomerase/thioredoxin